MISDFKKDENNILQSQEFLQIEKAIDYINRNYMVEISIEDLLNVTNLSKSYFYKLFKKKTNMSPFRYRRFIQLQEAKRMLMNTEMPIFEISHSVGFEDQFYFSKIFKYRYGCSPLEIRNRKEH